MSGVSLTRTIMYTKLLFVSYPPNIQTIILGRDFGGRAEKHLSRSKGVLKALYSQWLSWGAENRV